VERPSDLRHTRFQYLSELYGYLAKQFTVFGQHVHIGCPDPDSALFLLHSMSRFIPHFIAFRLRRLTFRAWIPVFIPRASILSLHFRCPGGPPFTLTWDSFEEYFSKRSAPAWSTA